MIIEIEKVAVTIVSENVFTLRGLIFFNCTSRERERVSALGYFLYQARASHRWTLELLHVNQ